jgi:hypothetical protein
MTTVPPLARSPAGVMVLRVWTGEARIGAGLTKIQNGKKVIVDGGFPTNAKWIQSWTRWSYLGRDIRARIWPKSKRELALVRSSSTADSSFMIALVDCYSMALPNTRLLLKPPALLCSMPWTLASQSSMLSIMMVNVISSSRIEANISKKPRRCLRRVCRKLS